jgi:hypothetical protein
MINSYCLVNNDSKLGCSMCSTAHAPVPSMIHGRRSGVCSTPSRPVIPLLIHWRHDGGSAGRVQPRRRGPTSPAHDNCKCRPCPPRRHSSNHGPAPPRFELDLSIFRTGLKKIMFFRTEKILPMTIPLDVSGLNFQAGLRPPAHFIV